MKSPSLDTVLHRAGQLQQHLPGTTSLLLGVAVFGALTVPGVWLAVRHIVAFAHEGAHAVMGSSMGHKIVRMTFKPNGDGATSLQAVNGHGPGIITAAVGYLGPSLFGLGAAYLIEAGHIIAVPWLALLALACTIPLLKDVVSALFVLVTGVLLYLAARYAPVGAQVILAYGIAWFLLVAGIKIVREHGSGASDAEVLRGLTHLPRGFWSRLWLAGTVAALAAGAWILA